MRCHIDGCINDAAHVVDAEGGAAYRLCSAHVPVKVTAISGVPVSVNLRPPAASITMLGGFAKRDPTVQ